jgi:hypothetical protein
MNMSDKAAAAPVLRASARRMAKGYKTNCVLRWTQRTELVPHVVDSDHSL